MQTNVIESAIKRKMYDVKVSLDFANRRLEDTHQNILHLKNEQIIIYQKIATIFLLESPENDNKQIQMLIMKLHKLFGQLKNRSQELEKITADYHGEISGILSQIDQLVIEKVILLEKDEDYLSLFNQFKYVEENFQKEDSTIDEVQQEFSQKLAQYSQNACYKYLIKRQFGEVQYRGFWIFRNLDAWVARHVNFIENSKNQKILESLIQESQHRYEVAKEAYKLALQKKQDKELEIEERLKLPLLRSQLLKAQQALDSYQKQKENNYKNLNEIEHGQGNEFYEIANQLAKIMQQQSKTALERLTLQTKSVEDDILLQKLSGLDLQIQQLQFQLPALKQKAEALKKTYSRFNQVFFIFKQNNIPSAFYEYNISSASLNDLLNKLLDSVVFPETIAQALIACRTSVNRASSSRSTSSGWSVGWGSGSHHPSYRPSSRGGFSSKPSSSSRGNGFSSSSSSGGGGFKTTDSF